MRRENRPCVASIELVLESSDSEVEDVVSEIAKTVQDFLESAVALKTIQGEKNEVVISSSNGKKMRVINN